MQCRDSHVAHRGKEVKQASPMILHPDTHTRARARDYICTYMYKYLITTRPVAPSTPTLGRLPRPRHSQGPASEDLPPTPTPLYKMGRWVQPGKADRLGAPGPFLQRSKSKPKPISLELQLLGLEPLRSEVLASPYPRSPPRNHALCSNRKRSPGAVRSYRGAAERAGSPCTTRTAALRVLG